MEQESAPDEQLILGTVLGSFTLEQLIEMKLEQLGIDRPDMLPPVDGSLWKACLGALERPLIHAVHRKHMGNQVWMARTLGVNRNTIRVKLKACGLLGDRG